MRAQLWMDKGIHWQRKNYADHCAEFSVPSPVRFVFCDNGNLSLREVDQIYCAVVEIYRDGLAVDVHDLTFTLHQDEEGSFRFPVNCVWVAGEEEL